MLGLCCELNRHINGGKLHLKSFPGLKANQLIPILEKHQYDAAAIHVGIKQHLQTAFVMTSLILHYVAVITIPVRRLFQVLLTVPK